MEYFAGEKNGEGIGEKVKKPLCKGPCVTGLPCLNRAMKEGYCKLHYKLYVEQNQNFESGKNQA